VFIKSHITAECISRCACSTSLGIGEEQGQQHGHSTFILWAGAPSDPCLAGSVDHLLHSPAPWAVVSPQQ